MDALEIEHLLPLLEDFHQGVENLMDNPSKWGHVSGRELLPELYKLVGKIRINQREEDMRSLVELLKKETSTAPEGDGTSETIWNTEFATDKTKNLGELGSEIVAKYSDLVSKRQPKGIFKVG